MIVSLKTKISTPHVNACAAFYEDLLGLHPVETWDNPNDAGIILALGAAPYTALIELYLHETGFDYSGLSLQFKVDDLLAFLDTVPDGLPYEGPTARPWGARYAYFTDPAGVSVIIFDGPTF